MTTSALAYRQVSSQNRRNELILSHLPLVRHILGKMAAQFPPGVDLENLESAGVLGLVEAAANFNPERNAVFKTFAYLRVRGAILDELRRNCPLPQHMLEAVARIRKAYRTLPTPVSVEALAQATGMTEDAVSDALAAVRLTRMASWGPEAEPLATRLDDHVDSPDAALEMEETRAQLAKAVDSLSERERTVVTLYFREDLRLKEISKVVGLSESRVSRILNGALFHLGERLRVVDA